LCSASATCAFFRRLLWFSLDVSWFLLPVAEAGAWKAHSRSRQCRVWCMAGSSQWLEPVIALYVRWSRSSSDPMASSHTHQFGHHRRRGRFDITGLYTCASGSEQVYLVATEVDPGAGTNAASALMAAMGRCDNLSSAPFIKHQRSTTVAAAYCAGSVHGRRIP